MHNTDPTKKVVLYHPVPPLRSRAGSNPRPSANGKGLGVVTANSSKRHKFYLAAIELLILWYVGVVHAGDINFEVNTTASYDSNIHRATTAPKEDTYFTLAPRAILKLPFDKVYFGSDIRVAMEQHVSETNANLQELVFSGLGRYNPSDYMSFGLRDELVVSGRSKSVEKLADATRSRKFVDNRLLSGVKHELKGGTLVTSLEYTSIIRNYRYTERDDWVSHSGQLSVEYFIGHRTSSQMVFGLRRKLYEVDVDYISVPIAIMLKRELSSKLDTKLSLGIESRRYNGVHQDRDSDKPSVSLDIVGRFTPKTSSRLLLQRRVYDSDIATGYAFVSTAADVALALSPSDAAELTVQGLYSRNSYIQTRGTDNVFGGRGTVRHSLSRWGAVLFSYGYEGRISSVPDNDYQQHVIELSYIVLF